MNELLKLILVKTVEHLELLFISLTVSMLIAIPLGIYLAKCQRRYLKVIVLQTIATLQTVPGLAMLSIVIVCISWIRPIVSLPTTGFLPAVIVLVAYALLPIMSCTYRAMTGINEESIQVAKAVGMTPKETLLYVEIPLSFSEIMGGVRLAMVWTVAMITLTALIGSGGLGDLILRGLKTMQSKYVLAGTVPAAIIAITIDRIFDWICKITLPSHMP